MWWVEQSQAPGVSDASPLLQLAHFLLLDVVPPSLTYLPAAQVDHVEHEPWLDEDVYFPVKQGGHQIRERHFDDQGSHE